MHPTLSGPCEILGIAESGGEAVLRLRTRLSGDLSGGLVRPLENRRHLTTDTFQGSANGALGGAGGVQLGDQLGHALHEGVDRHPVVAAEDDGKVLVGHRRDRVVRQLGQGRSYLLHDRVLSGSGALIGHRHRIPPPSQDACRSIQWIRCRTRHCLAFRSETGRG